MDIVQDWASFLWYRSGPLLTYLNPYAGQFAYGTAIFKSWIYPLINQVIAKPDLATVALLLVIILVSLKLLDMLWQSVKFWLRMAWKIVFYGGMAALGLWFWTRGPDGVAQDVQTWTHKFNKEHAYWIDQEKTARLHKQKTGYGTRHW